jgi:hypothetical protein
MATRVQLLDSIVTSTYSLPRNCIVTLSDDAAATALIAAGRAVAVADATTCNTLFAADRWMAVKVGTGAV